MKAYEDMQEKPAIETTKNTFKIILPNINAKYEIKKETVEIESDTHITDNMEKRLSDREEEILEYVRKNGVITRNEAIELLEVSASTAVRVIRKMVKANLLKQNGKARNTHYTLTK